jgi:hypothetical protein
MPVGNVPVMVKPTEALDKVYAVAPSVPTPEALTETAVANTAAKEVPPAPPVNFVPRFAVDKLTAKVVVAFAVAEKLAPRIALTDVLLTAVASEMVVLVEVSLLVTVKVPVLVPVTEPKPEAPCTVN